MAEVLIEFPGLVESDDGVVYRARAAAAPMDDSLWEGWIEFIPVEGGGPVRSPRETTQPNLRDAAYWATGLSPVYLQGALERALTRAVRHRTPPAAEPRTRRT
jgi:hypothetical protein